MRGTRAYCTPLHCALPLAWAYCTPLHCAPTIGMGIFTWYYAPNKCFYRSFDAFTSPTCYGRGAMQRSAISPDVWIEGVPYPDVPKQYLKSLRRTTRRAIHSERGWIGITAIPGAVEAKRGRTTWRD